MDPTVVAVGASGVLKRLSDTDGTCIILCGRQVSHTSHVEAKSQSVNRNMHGRLEVVLIAPLDLTEDPL